MKTTQQIINDTVENSTELQEELKYYGLTIEDVGLQTIQSKEYFLDGEDKPIILNYSVQDDAVVSRSISFVHSKTDDSMREKRLERIGK
jgi:hypothetical protein